MRPQLDDHAAETDQLTDSEQSLANLLEQVTRALDEGETVDVDELAGVYPQHADRLRELMPTMLAMAAWGRAPSTDERGEAALFGGARVAGVLGDFRILGELGRGGMGTVFEAEQISMGRRVALKVLPFAALAQAKALQRFRNEVRAAAALDHPHIVSVYSVGEERGIHYYSMQLIRGQSLAEVIADFQKDEERGEKGEERRENSGRSSPLALPSSPLDTAPLAALSTVRTTHPERYWQLVARLGLQAAEALQHAHDQGVLHRDIKPGNLLLDADGNLFVADFGLARIEAEAGMTLTGDILGTLRYMAPEQALAKRVVIDHRADVYSLGATLYELLTLEPAFTATDRAELLKQIGFEEPTRPRKLDRHIPVELETIVQKALAKGPEERYQTAQQLADDLRAYLDNRPIKAQPPTIVDVVTKKLSGYWHW